MKRMKLRSVERWYVIFKFSSSESVLTRRNEDNITYRQKRNGGQLYCCNVDVAMRIPTTSGNCLGIMVFFLSSSIGGCWERRLSFTATLWLPVQYSCSGYISSIPSPFASAFFSCKCIFSLMNNTYHRNHRNHRNQDLL